MARKKERQWGQAQGVESQGFDPVLVEAIRAMGGLGRLLEKRLEIQLEMRVTAGTVQRHTQQLEQAQSSLARIDGTFFEVSDLLRESLIES